MLTIDECWKALEALATSDQKPPKTLPQGATLEAITVAEKAMGVVLPADFRRFLELHDGSDRYFFSPWKAGGGSQRFMSIREIVQISQGMTQIGQDFERDEQDFGKQTGPVKRRYWNPRWIPLAENESGDNIVVDLDPAAGGSTGQIVDWWHESAESTWVSVGLREFLNEIVQEVRSGNYRFHST